MEEKLYDQEDKEFKDFWWHHGRKKLFIKNLKKFTKLDSKILEIGSSTGNYFSYIKKKGFVNLHGIENNKYALKRCRRKGLKSIIKGSATKIPFKKNTLDFVLATDVIEHIKNDKLAIKEIHRVLKPGHHALITVPAFNFFWSKHDIKSHHKRRYTKNTLKELIKPFNFSLCKIFYFNYLLAIPIILVRFFLKCFKIDLKSENEFNNWFINKILKIIFTIDIKSSYYVNPPFGFSIFLLIKKKLD